ncbi:MAG: gamma-glutamyltransferase [Flavobacteriaceae bacterium]|nr:gamma-glutamyltransferase [Flavobacteriaceae bacterium]
MLKKIILLVFISFFIFSCKLGKYKNGMVVSAKAEASKVGVEILKKGGNAFDAMIATDLALAVVYPNAGNLGGGGFMVYRLNNGDNGSLDFREKAPIASTKNMFLDTNNDIIKGASQVGGLSVGVPGTVAGLFEVHKKFGTIPMSELIQPAIDLAKNGYKISEKQAYSLNLYVNEIYTLNDSINLFSKKFNKDDLFVNNALANTLEIIQENGKEAFYNGVIAKKIVEYLETKNGIITLEDLAKYNPVWRDALNFKYKNLNIITMGPPSSGGIVLAQILRMINNYDLKNINHNSEKYIQLLVESERLAFADRSKYLGDPDFNNIPVKELLNEKYLEKRFSIFDFEKSNKSEDVMPGEILKESNETTHYSIVDRFGNAVSVTTTLNGNYGSKLISDELGFFFNNEMDDFSIKPGFPNMYGLIGGEINAIEPEKRMLSSMTPTIIEENEELSMILGSPGGPTIITSVLQTILNFYEYNFEMQESVDKSRFHHLWLPDKIYYESGVLDDDLKNNLKQKGYKFNNNESTIGRVDAIHIDKEKYFHPGADKRGDDTAIGF